MSPQTESVGGSSSRKLPERALVYFAKAPVPGAVKTRLCPPLTTDEAAALYGAFLRACVRPVPGVRTLVYGWPGTDDPDAGLSLLAAALPAGYAAMGIELRPQRGADLWERMRNCFAELFAEGHTSVVLRNTDSPDLPEAVVAEALAQSRSGRVVLGPDPGGGYYLVGLAEPHPELFGPAVEGADSVLATTREVAAAEGVEVLELPVHADVDTFEDLLGMWRRRGGG